MRGIIRKGTFLVQAQAKAGQQPVQRADQGHDFPGDALRHDRRKIPGITLVDGGTGLDSEGSYGREGWIYQGLAPLPRFGDDYALVGSWIIDGQPAGIGLREDASPITRNTSRFVPHYFVAD